MAMEEMSNELISLDTLDSQRIIWSNKAQSIPSLKGGKKLLFPLVIELVKLIGENKALDLKSVPEIQVVSNPATWNSYARFLCVMDLASIKGRGLQLTKQGEAFLEDPSKTNLASIIHNRIRIFGEIVLLLGQRKMTVDEMNNIINEQYNMNWSTTNSIRSRFDWLEVLGLIQPYGNFKWGATEEGLSLVKTWSIVTPMAIKGEVDDVDEMDLAEAPVIIAELLNDLQREPSKHVERNTYNIWIPSPNIINNLKEIVQVAYDSISKRDLFSFIAEHFNLKTSSIDSMMPFLKASSFIEETRRNVFQATSLSKAWLETGSDLDLIRILHAKVRYVGEILEAARNGSSRKSLYEVGKSYGQNSTRVSWIMKFLLDSKLLEELRYLYVKTTPLGIQLMETLPLANPEIFQIEAKEDKNNDDDSVNVEENHIANRLELTSQDPMAEGKQSGVAFEEAIAEIFTSMGFDAKRIGGPGDTDVIVQWKDENDSIIKAIVDGKSKSSGGVTHNDFNSIALDTHKSKNNASFIAIVAHSFAGNTINTYARKESIALITTEELTRYLNATIELGLAPNETSLIFKVPDGMAKLEEIIEQRKRELEVVTTVVDEFRKKQEEIGALSSRDLYMLLLNSNDSASKEELDKAFVLLSNPVVGVLQNSSIRNETNGYILKDAPSVARRLHALAYAIERGSSEMHKL